MASRVKLRLYAQIKTVNGVKTLEYRNRAYLDQQVAQYREGANVVVVIESNSPNRSRQQNNYWCGVCYPLLAEMTGYTDTEIHEWCKTAFLEPKIITVRGKPLYIPRSTSSLTVSEGVEYTDKLRNLGVELGGYIPTPEDAGYISNTKK